LIFLRVDIAGRRHGLINYIRPVAHKRIAEDGAAWVQAST
jgi:hypothetical protein